MAGYLIANIDVHDPETFAKYRDQVAPLIAKFGGRYLVRGGALEQVEAGAASFKRVVILEFPSLAEVKRFYESADYAPVLELRLKSSKGEVALVEGFTG